MLNVNDILSADADRKTAIDGIARVIGVSHDGATVALIRLDIRPLHAPYLLPVQSVDPDIEENGIVRLEKFDCGLHRFKEDLSAQSQGHLANILEMMRTTMTDIRMTMDAEYRGREIARIAQRFGVHPRTIRRHYYDFLWGGMVEMAFIGPRKHYAGRTGRQQPGTRKRGRISTNEYAGKEGSRPIYDFLESLEKGARRFFFSGKYTEEEAYVRTKKQYFSNGKKATRASGNKIVLEDLLLPPEQLPSKRQFHYVIGLLRKNGNTRETKPGDLRPPRTRTVRLAKARSHIPGPGYRYEIDATRVQNRIVSRLDPSRLVREATLYIIIDVWSGAIVGYAISLAPASWLLAAKALHNCFTSKAEVFSRLGLPYTEEDWVSAHLPTNLTADRGEFVSDKAGVVPEIGINVEIMPPMCPERKGTVEGKFKAIKHGDNFYSKPGKHNKNLQRREKDGKKEATFTLEEFEKLLVEIILDLNNDPVPTNSIPVDAVNTGESAITYGGLFAWGLKHRTGFTRKLDDTTVTNELMIRGDASVTPEGIRFKKQNYTSDTLLKSGLPARAAAKGNFSIQVRYDDLAGDRIRYFDPVLQAWTNADNDNPDIQRLHASFWEIEKHLFKAEALHALAKENNISNRHEKSLRLNKSTKTAMERTKRAKAANPRRSSKEEIGLNTNLELAAGRTRRVLAEKRSIAEAIIASQTTQALPGKLPDPTSPNHDGPPNRSAPAPESPIAQPSSTKPTIGQRALTLWKMQNADREK